MPKVPSIRLNGRPSRPRNSFDVSERSLYSQPVGAITPVFVRDLNPGDHLDVSIASLLQAQTLKGRAFFNGKQKFAGFFVPYKQLWSGWESWFTGLKPSLVMSSTNLLDGSPSLVTRTVPHEEKVFDDGSTVSSFMPRFKPFDVLLAISDGTTPKSDSVFDRNTPLGNSPFFADVHGIRYDLNFVRLLDLLGYGNVHGLLLTEKKRTFKYGGVNGSVSGTTVDVPTELNLIKNKVFNLFRFAAYQKIYQDYYLDDTFEFRNPFSYNLDYISKNFSSGVVSGDLITQDAAKSNTYTSRLASVFQMRYAHYEKDYLSNLIPYHIDNSNFSSFAPLPAYGDPYYTSGSATFDRTSQNVNAQSVSSVSVTTIRAAFALDKMLQISSRAGKSYKEQIRAHYGEDVSNSIDSCYYCGGFDKRLDVNAVVATGAGSPTADGADASYLGQQSGFIDSGSSGRIVCDAKDFGVFMIVSYVTVEPRYDAYVDPFTLKQSRSDFFIPEFEDLGLQPIYRYNFGLIGKESDDWNKVLSWQPRYAEYKSSFNRLHGVFGRNGSLSFLSPRKDYKIHNDVRSFDSSMFLISPKVLDNTVEIAYDGSQNTDPFRVETHFAASLVSNMSVSGLAKLI